MLVMDKYSSLVDPFVSYEKMKRCENAPKLFYENNSEKMNVNSGSTVVDSQTSEPEIKGSNPAAAVQHQGSLLSLHQNRLERSAGGKTLKLNRKISKLKLY